MEHFKFVGAKLNQLALFLLSSERINGLRAKTSRETMRERVPFHLSKTRTKRHQKLAAAPPTLRASFSSFGGVERAFSMLFSGFFARTPLTLSYDNTET